MTSISADLFIDDRGDVRTPAVLAARLARPVGDALRDRARRDGLVLDPMVAAWVSALEVVGRLDRLGVDTSTVREPVPDTLGTVSITQMAERLGVSRQAVWKRCERGTISAVRVDGTWRILEEDAA